MEWWMRAKIAPSRIYCSALQRSRHVRQQELAVEACNSYMYLLLRVFDECEVDCEVVHNDDDSDLVLGANHISYPSIAAVIIPRCT